MRHHVVVVTFVSLSLTFGWRTDVPAQPAPQAPASAFAVAAGEPIWAPRFVSNPANLQWTMEQVRDLGARMLRVHIPWDAIERAEGQQDWSATDAIVEQAARAGVRLLFLIQGYMLGERFRPTDRRLPYSAGGEIRLRAYEEFVRAFARRYKGRVQHWQIENEVDMPELGYWAGSVEEYVQVLRVAYRAIKAEEPDARVLIAGMAGVPGPLPDATGRATDRVRAYIERLKGLLAAARNDYDILDLHTYTPVGQMRARLDFFRQQIRSLGDQKPIWITETGGPHPCMLRTPAEPPPEVQSGEVVKRYAVALAWGAARVFWFSLRSLGTQPAWECPQGLAANTFWFMALLRGQDRRPAFSAYQLMVRKLDGFSEARQLTLEPGVWAFRFLKPSGDVYVAWADQPTTTALQVTARTIVVTDIAGASTERDPAGLALTSLPVFAEPAR